MAPDPEAGTGPPGAGASPGPSQTQEARVRGPENTAESPTSSKVVSSSGTPTRFNTAPPIGSAPAAATRSFGSVHIGKMKESVQKYTDVLREKMQHQLNQVVRNVQKTVNRSVRVQMWDLAYYSTFVVLFSLVTLLPFAVMSSDAYFFIQVVHGNLVERNVPDPSPTFLDVKDQEKFWKWVQGPFFYTAYGFSPWHPVGVEDDQEPCPTEIPGMPYEFTGCNYSSGVPRGHMSQNAIFLGNIRLRQERVGSSKCKTEAEELGVFLERCRYPEYSWSVRAEDHYDWPAWRNERGEWRDAALGAGLEAAAAAAEIPDYDGFMYATSNELESTHYAGRLGWYRGDGYAVTLPVDDPMLAKARLDHLFANDWIDAQTRAVHLEFTLYMPYKDIVNGVRLAVEFHPSGYAIPRTMYSTFELHMYDTGKDYLRAAAEIVLAFLIVGLLAFEVYRVFAMDGFIREMGLTFYLISLFNNVMIGTALCLTVYILIEISELQDKLEQDYVPSVKVARVLNDTRSLICIVALFAWFRVFRYTQNLPKLGIVGRTINRSLPAISSFIAMSFVVFIGFAQSFYMAFFATVEGYQSMAESMITMLRFTLGDYDYDALEQENRILAPLLFTLVVVVVFFVWVNVVIAIVSNSYDEEVRLATEFHFDEDFKEDMTGFGPEFDSAAYYDDTLPLQPSNYNRFIVHSLSLFKPKKLYTVTMKDYAETTSLEHVGVILRVGELVDGNSNCIQAVYFDRSKHTITSASQWWGSNRKRFLVGDAIMSGITTTLRSFANRGKAAKQSIPREKAMQVAEMLAKSMKNTEGANSSKGAKENKSVIVGESGPTIVEADDRMDMRLVLEQHLQAISDRIETQYEQMRELEYLLNYR